MDSSVDLKNLILAFGISVLIVFAWQIAFPQPVPQPAATLAQPLQNNDNAPVESTNDRLEDMDMALSQLPRLPIQAEEIQGSLPTMGAGLRIDNLTLTQYRTELDPESPAVTLLKPSQAAGAYFTEFGWSSQQQDITLPSATTRWKVSGDGLTENSPLTFQWTSPEGLTFTTILALHDDYLFTILRKVENRSGKPVTLQPYALINREYLEEQKKHYAILHEGPFGVFNQTLEEIPYKELREDPDHLRRFESTGGWAGISDKYWFTALIPAQDASRTTQLRHYTRHGFDRYQLDVSAAPILLKAGESTEVTTHLFAGPKKLSLLDRYAEEFGVPLFDRAVDFGALYFLTRPLFEVLEAIYGYVGNFGIAIMILTVFIRILLFPLANKSYKSLAHMRAIQPKMMEIREKYKDDRTLQSQELMNLYRKEKVNPMAGCLPILVQIPIFFALYKVLFVTIEMRHAPFYGWIHDLSAKDPLIVTNLFGLIPWDPPGILQIGVLPLLMTITMIIQQKLNPPPPDPMQAKMLQFLPYIFLFLFAQFPAGLVLYWTWNNVLSILQQWIIIKKHGRPEPVKTAS